MNSGARRESLAADRDFVPDEQEFVPVQHDFGLYVPELPSLVARTARIQ
jgi:hypothetical protein